MNGQTAFMSSSFLQPLHTYYSSSLHSGSLHRGGGHPPTQSHQSHQSHFNEGGLAPPSSAALPFRPAAAGLPVVDHRTHTNSNHHQVYPDQNNHSQLHSDQFLHPSTLRMGSFEQSQNEELARLQELSNKWEPEANASLSQSISPRVFCLLSLPSH
jgi:hypothetical protein